MKFLVIRFSSIGDIVLTSPLVRCLKLQVKEAEIHFITKGRYAELLAANPYIDKLHFLNDHFGTVLKALRAEKFSYVIDLHNNIRSLRIKRALHVPSVSFNKLNFRKWLLVNLKVNTLPQQHIVERYIHTLSRFQVVPDGRGLDYFIPGGQEFDITALPEEYRNGFIAFVISGTHATKQLPAEKVAGICREIPYPVILIGGTRELSLSQEIERLAGRHLVNLTGKTTLSGSASLIRDARVVLANDTGMMHIAAAYGKRILSFWGNTVPELGMYPFLPHPSSKLMQVEGLKCRPCSKLGFRECPRKHFRCMNDIDIRECALDYRELRGVEPS